MADLNHVTNFTQARKDLFFEITTHLIDCKAKWFMIEPAILYSSFNVSIEPGEESQVCQPTFEVTGTYTDLLALTEYFELVQGGPFLHTGKLTALAKHGYNVLAQIKILYYLQHLMQEDEYDYKSKLIFPREIGVAVRAFTYNVENLVSDKSVGKEKVGGGLPYLYIQDKGLKRIETGIYDLNIDPDLKPASIQAISSTEENKIASPRLPQQTWSFIKNAKLKEMLARDYAELGELLKVQAPKATLVMCGSIMEAALIAVLSRRKTSAIAKFYDLYLKAKNPAKATPPFDEWKLYQLIEVAAEIKILDDDARRHAGIVKDYRNLIHPAAEIRRESKVDGYIVTSMLALPPSVPAPS